MGPVLLCSQSVSSQYGIPSEGRVIWSLFKKLTRFIPLTSQSLMDSHGSRTEG
jgi:hypothetical protein